MIPISVFILESLNLFSLLVTSLKLWCQTLTLKFLLASSFWMLLFVAYHRKIFYMCIVYCFLLTSFVFQSIFKVMHPHNAIKIKFKVLIMLILWLLFFVVVFFHYCGGYCNVVFGMSFVIFEHYYNSWFFN